MQYLLSIAYLMMIVFILGFNEDRQKETLPLIANDSNNSLIHTRSIISLGLDFS